MGTVLKLGTGVGGWSPGDRAALEAPIYCYHCEFCMTGRHNLCANVRFMSSPEEPGFFRDRVNLPAAVVIGTGPIGLSTIAALKIAGASRIYAIDPLPHRRALARELGATEVFADVTGAAVPAADMVFDCAAKGDSINQAIRIVRPTGRVIITGVPSEVKPAIEFHTLRRKEAGFFTVRRYNHTAEPALRLLSDHLSRFAPMVTHRRPLEEVQRTFETLEAYADGIGKAVLLPGN